MMHFDFNREEETLFHAVATVAHFRTSNLAMLYGDFINVSVDKNIWIYARKYFDNEVIVVINNSDEEKKFEIELPEALKKREFISLFIPQKTEYKVDDNKLKITLQPFSAEVFY
jgi:glycosidase